MYNKIGIHKQILFWDFALQNINFFIPFGQKWLKFWNEAYICFTIQQGIPSKNKNKSQMTLYLPNFIYFCELAVS